MLTERQVKLLNAIIKEYVESTEPVGSQILVRKYNLKYSPATVRNEMARLLEEGFLQMLHTSSGRIPTSMAYRLFLTDLMEEEELPVLQEVALKQRLWPHRFEFEKLLRQAAVGLAEYTKELSLVMTNDGYLVQAGAVNILDNKEFWDIEAAKSVLHLLDRPEMLETVFQKAPYGDDVRCVIGNEIGRDALSHCGVVFAPFTVEKASGYIAVIGPARMKYAQIIPAVRYTKNLVHELVGSW